MPSADGLPPSTAVPIIHNIFGLSDQTLGEVKLWLEQQGLIVPISQVAGFKQFLAQTSTGSNSVTGTLATGTNTTGAGPGIAAMAAGSYMFLAGYNAAADATVVTGSLAVKVNGSTAFTLYGAGTGSGGSATAGSFATFAPVTLSGASSDVTSLVSVANSAGTSRTYSFTNIQIVALKFGN